MSIGSSLKVLIGDANPLAGLVMAYWKPILCVLALLAAYGAGYYREAGNCTAEATALREKQEQAIIDQQVSVIAKERRATGITMGVSNDVENAISAITKRYDGLDGVLGQIHPNPAAVSGVPASAAGHHGSTGNCGLSQSAARRKIEEKLDIQTQRLIGCQAFITQQQQNMLSKPSN